MEMENFGETYSHIKHINSGLANTWRWRLLQRLHFIRDWWMAVEDEWTKSHDLRVDLYPTWCTDNNCIGFSLRWNCNWQPTEWHTLSISFWVWFFTRRCFDVFEQIRATPSYSRQYKTNEPKGWSSIILKMEVHWMQQQRPDEINWTKVASHCRARKRERKLFFVLKLSQIKFSSIPCATKEILVQIACVCFYLFARPCRSSLLFICALT